MSKTSEQLLQNALINNSFSKEHVNQSLNYVTRHSYQYLHQLQANTTLFEQFHYRYNNELGHIPSVYIRDYYRNETFDLCIDLNYNLFDIGHMSAYRNSKYYLKRVTYEDILYEEKLFTRIPILMINNHIITDMDIIINEYQVTFILHDEPEIFTRNSLNDMLSHDINILLINHPHYYHSDRVTYEYWTMYNPIDQINPTLISDKMDASLNSILWFEYWDRAGKPSKGTNHFFLTLSGTNYRITDMTDDVKNVLKTCSTFRVHVIQIPRLHQYAFLNEDKSSSKALKYYENGEMCTKVEPIVITRDTEDGYTVMDHPIPISSFLVYRKRASEHEWVLLQAQEVLKLHYPNIYEFIDKDMQAGDSYRCYYHFNDPTYEDRLIDVFTPKEDINWIRYCHNKYNNRHLFFYRWLFHKTSLSQKQNVKELYLNPTTFIKRHITTNENDIARIKEVWSILFNYKWYHHNTDITDYSHAYQFNKITEKEERSKEPIEYKVDKMWEFIHDDDKVLHDYVVRQNIVGESHFLFANTTHMNERKRMDSYAEMSNGMVFDEEMVLFEFREYTTTHPFEIRVFVDGVYAHKAHILQEHDTYYVYVPASMFEWDSYCEIELFPSFLFKEDIKITNMSEDVIINLDGLFSNKIQPTLADLFVTLTGYDRVTFSDSFFKIIAQDKNNEIIYTDDNGIRYKEFSPMRKFKLSLTDPVALNYGTDFTVRFEKNPYLLEMNVTEDGFPTISLEGLQFKPRADYIRIFKNGKLMTPGCFTVTYRTKPCIIQFFVSCKKGDHLTIDITPYKYKEIYYQEELLKGEFLVDVSNIITKPFCNRYYDVYINGRKMSWNSVFAITPTKLTFVNLRSVKHLQIFEIERDDEYFGLDYTVINRDYTLDDFINESFITPDDLTQIIIDRIEDDKHPDLVIRDHPFEPDEERYIPDDFYDNMLDYYYNELIPKQFIDPDTLQSDHDYVAEQFPVIGTHYFIRNNCIILDPDLLIKGKNPDQHMMFTYGANENLL